MQRNKKYIMARNEAIKHFSKTNFIKKKNLFLHTLVEQIQDTMNISNLSIVKEYFVEKSNIAIHFNLRNSSMGCNSVADLKWCVSNNKLAENLRLNSPVFFLTYAIGH